MTTSEPIACTLTSSDYAQRVSWIAEFNRADLLSHRLEGTVLTLRYRASAVAKVHELVDREKECCAFLHFTVREEGEVVVLEIRAPEESGVTAAQLLSPFLAGTSAEVPAVGSCGDPSCACGSPTSDGPPRPVVAAVAKSGAGIAIACGICCLLPFALPAVAATSAGAFVAAFGTTYWWAMKIAMGLALFGWGWIAWQSIRTGKRAHPKTVRAMLIATLVLALARTWPYVERYIIGLLTN